MLFTNYTTYLPQLNYQALQQKIPYNTKLTAIAVWINIILGTILLANAVYRDMQFEKQYPADLRNRQVGARLIEDGKLPYFYKWKQGDPERYYDPSNADSLKVSVITATPFFHRLLAPVCDMPFSSLSKFWIAAQYTCFILIVVAALSLCTTPFNRLVVLNTAILFLYTEAWMMHVKSGQVYIINAALFSIIAWLLLAGKKQWMTIAAGFFITVLILTRPIAVVLLVPFLLFYKQNKKLLLFSALNCLLYGLFCVASPFERALWKDYTAGMAEQVKLHQNMRPALQHNDTMPINVLEGYNRTTALKLAATIPNKSENGNVFHLYHIYLHKVMPVYVLNGLWVITMFFCCFYYYRKTKPLPFNIAAAVIFALTLYMLTEIFSPVYRHQYNTVQWLPIALIALACMRNYLNLAALFIVTGILLNVTNTHLLPMRHTIGEFFLLTGLLLAVYRSNNMLKTYTRQAL